MDWSLIGLIFDIIGVLILARALALPSDEQLLMLSGTYLNGNRGLFVAFVEQRHDARFGLAIVVLGFVLQAIGAAGLQFPNRAIGWIIAVLVLLVTLAGYFFCRKAAGRRAVQFFDARIGDRETKKA